MNVVAQITAIAGRARTGAAHGRVVVPAGGAHGHAVRGVHAPGRAQPAERARAGRIRGAVPGHGDEHLNADEPGGIQELDPGAVATFEYRVTLSPATSAQVTHGTAAFDVTLEFLPGHGLLGVAPSGSAAIVIQAGQPPA